MDIYEALDKVVSFNDSKIETMYNGKKLVLFNPKIYDGPITLQSLPYGGIQSVYNNLLIINTKNGFIFTDLVEYNGILMTTKKFIEIEDNLVNHVLPS